ncbi:MAG: hypothetical protein HXL00_04545 [Candidatus Nanosynbacter sp.]|jgi:hypothetical protein|nr:hypothetical protein [Candidatus Nanosynbacter sp.]
MTRTQAQEAFSTLYSTPRERVTTADQAAAVVQLSQIALHMMTKFADKVDVYGYRMDNAAPAKEADSPLFPNQSRAILRLMAPYHDGSNLLVDIETATFWREPVQPNASDNAIAATAHEVSLVSDSEQLRYRIVTEGSHQRVVRSLIGLAHSGQPATRTIGESQRIGRGDQVVSEAEVQRLWEVLNGVESFDAPDDESK